MIWLLIFGQSFLKENDQLHRWFEDDDALEQAISGEYVHISLIFVKEKDLLVIP